MGCGSLLGDLFCLVDVVLGGSSFGQLHSYPLATNGKGYEVESGEDLYARLYRMHGEGQISEDVFHALRGLAERGRLRSADLAVHQARAARGAVKTGDPAIHNALRGIRSRLEQLQRVRATSESALADLEKRRMELDERIAGKEQAAREAVVRDEATARQRLAEKGEIASSRLRLLEQAQALRADLARLKDLCSQLELKAAELESIQARVQLRQEMLK